MQPIFRLGRCFYASTVVALGIVSFFVRHLPIALFPWPEGFPAKQFLWGLIATLFVAAGIGMMINKSARRFALLAAVLFFLILVYPNLVLLFQNIHNGGVWTVIGELAALGAGALILTGKIPGSTTHAADGSLSAYTAGRIIFALSLLIFGILHFQYADYIATLITSWIPFKLFWAYFVGLAFIAGFLSILTNVKIYLASALLGFMFLFWVLFEHLPRVIAKQGVEPEWTSLFIAAGFCGIFFMLAERGRIIEN
ncbi:MAG: hypothetical protein ABIY90_18570 [Puia sp.]